MTTRNILGALFGLQVQDAHLDLKNARKSMIDKDNFKKLTQLFVKPSVDLFASIVLIGGLFLILGILTSWNLINPGLILTMVCVCLSYRIKFLQKKLVFPRIIFWVLWMLHLVEWDIQIKDWIIVYSTNNRCYLSFNMANR